MNQQINFYRPEFQLRRTILTWQATARVLAVASVALIITYVFGQQVMHSVERELDVVTHQEQSAAQRLEKLQPVINTIGDGKSWAERVQEKESLLGDKRLVLQYVRHTNLGDSQGFSRHMRSLARIGLDGIWLTRIRLAARGEGTILEGNALKPDLVATYLQFLASEPPFAEQRFRRFQIEGDTESRDGPVRFSLVSEPDLPDRAVTAR